LKIFTGLPPIQYIKGEKSDALLDIARVEAFIYRPTVETLAGAAPAQVAKKPRTLQTSGEIEDGVAK
jgi:hypothetical protein